MKCFLTTSFEKSLNKNEFQGQYYNFTKLRPLCQTRASWRTYGPYTAAQAPYFERLRDFKSETGVKRKTMHYQNRDFYLIGSTGGVRNLPHYFYYLLSIY